MNMACRFLIAGLAWLVGIAIAYILSISPNLLNLCDGFGLVLISGCWIIGATKISILAINPDFVSPWLNE